MLSLSRIHYDLLIAIEIEASQVLAETNSIETVRFIDGRNNSTHALDMIIEDIRHILKNNSGFNIYRIFRETNHYVNLFAKIEA